MIPIQIDKRSVDTSTTQPTAVRSVGGSINRITTLPTNTAGQRSPSPNIIPKNPKDINSPKRRINGSSVGSGSHQQQQLLLHTKNNMASSVGPGVGNSPTMRHARSNSEHELPPRSMAPGNVGGGAVANSGGGLGGGVPLVHSLVRGGFLFLDILLCVIFVALFRYLGWRNCQ
jgi:hypothetical protein